MDKKYYALLLLLAGTVLSRQNLLAQEVIWIDKFEKADSLTLMKGEWLNYTDHSDSGSSEIKLNYFNDAKCKSQALRFSYRLQKGKCKWDPYAAGVCSLSVKQIDMNQMQGIAYEFKGSKHSFLYRTYSIKDYAYFQKTIPESKEWTTVIIPFTDLNQPNWGKKEALTERDVHSLAWQIQSKTNDSGAVCIDNVRLLKTMEESLLTIEQQKSRSVKRANQAKQEAFVYEVLNNLSDSLLKNIGADGIKIINYKQHNRAISVYERKIDSLLSLVKKYSLPKEEQQTLLGLILLAKNTVSGDVYKQVRELNKDLIIKFNSLIPLSVLYDLDKDYLKDKINIDATKSWVAELYNYSSSSEESTLLNTASDSALQFEVKLYGLTKKETVAEIGAGAGFLEQTISKYCDELTVYVNEIDSADVSKLKSKLAFLELLDKKNIKYIPVLGNEKSTNIPATGIDKIIIKNAFHHFSFPHEMLTDIKRIMKKKGKLFIVDTMIDETRNAYCPLLLTRKQIMDRLTENGFILINETKLKSGEVKCLEFQLAL